MSRKTALITGVTGQDGSYLAEFLLAQGYEVHGLARQSELRDPLSLQHISGIQDQITLHGAELDDPASVQRAVATVRPMECYHLAAQSFVSYSAADEASTLTANINGAQTVLSALRENSPDCRFFFASSSELFGRATMSPQNEQTPLAPRSVYGISKAAGHLLTRHYREEHGMHASCGIMYNHESPRRGPHFVTRKITLGAARIAAGATDKLKLGNLDALRDWGHARDYVQAMWLMLQCPTPSEYVIATGKLHSVRQFCELAFSRVGLRYEDWVESDPAFYRPVEEFPLAGDPAKAKSELGWQAATRFEELVYEMTDHDLQLAGVETKRRSAPELCTF